MQRPHVIGIRVAGDVADVVVWFPGGMTRSYRLARDADLPAIVPLTKGFERDLRPWDVSADICRQAGKAIDAARAQERKHSRAAG